MRSTGWGSGELGFEVIATPSAPSGAPEVDGSQHNEPEGLAKDARRDLYLRNNRYNVLRFWNVDIDTNLGGVIDTILLALEK